MTSFILVIIVLFRILLSELFFSSLWKIQIHKWSYFFLDRIISEHLWTSA